MQPQEILFDPDLQTAINELLEATDEARAEGYLLPSKLALSNAEKLLMDLYNISPQLFSVYPTENGEIAILASGGFGRSVLFLCDSNGEVLCSVILAEHHRRKRYADTSTLPDTFIRTALIDLAA